MEKRNASDLSKRVSAELRAARERHGWAWSDLETITGIPHATMNRMINGKVDIPVAKLMLICEAAGIEATDVIAEATRHMPDGYLRSLLSPNVSEVEDTVGAAEAPQRRRPTHTKAASNDEDRSRTS